MLPIELVSLGEKLNALFLKARKEPQGARWSLSDEYMPWYLSARELVKQRGPDHLEDFDQYYQGRRGRQIVTRDNYGIKDYFDGRSWTRSTPILEHAVAFINFERQRHTIKAVCLLPGATEADAPSASAPLEQIMMRFHDFVVALREHPHGRKGIQIEDEYDVQYLLKALLMFFFDDVRPEEWTPSYLGSSNKMDFLLKEQGIAIEVKVASQSHRDKKIGDELAIDIIHYKEVAGCHTLCCLIYDPGNHLRNRGGLIGDLTKASVPGLKVVSYISP